MNVNMAGITRTQWAIGGLALASVGVLAYSLVRPTKETKGKKKKTKKGPKAIKFEYKITKQPMDLHFVMATEEGFHAHVAGDKKNKNKNLKFGARLFKINDKKVENQTYEEIITQLQRVKVPATLTFKEFPELQKDWEKAEEYREKGNEFYKKGDAKKGIEECSKAIQLHPTNKVYYSNRILMYLKSNELEAALNDCQKIRELDPLSQYVKGHYLRGLVLFHLKKIKHAAAAFQTVMKLEPSFKQAKVRLDDCLKKLQVEEEKEQAKIVEKRRSSEQLLTAKQSNSEAPNAAVSAVSPVAEVKNKNASEGQAAAKVESIFEDTTVVANGDANNENTENNNDENKEDNSNNDNKNNNDSNENNDNSNKNENAPQNENENNENSDNKEVSVDDSNANDNNDENNDENNENNEKDNEQPKSSDDSYEKVSKPDNADADADADADAGVDAPAAAEPEKPAAEPAAEPVANSNEDKVEPAVEAPQAEAEA